MSKSSQSSQKSGLWMTFREWDQHEQVFIIQFTEYSFSLRTEAIGQDRQTTILFQIFLLVLWEFCTMYFDHIRSLPISYHIQPFPYPPNVLSYSPPSPSNLIYVIHIILDVWPGTATWSTHQGPGLKGATMPTLLIFIKDHIFILLIFIYCFSVDSLICFQFFIITFF